MDIRVNRNNLGALALIGGGGLLLAFQVLGINFFDMLGTIWPLFVMLPGLVFLAIAFLGDRKAAGFAFPGAIITGTGAILMYQSITDHWESWAYVWALYPALVGLALIFNGVRNQNDKEVRTGQQMAMWSGIAFAGLLVFFEFFIFDGNGSLTRYVIPAALVGIGGFMLLFNRGGSREKAKREYFEPAPSPRKIKPSYQSDADINPELRRKIDEAIAEEELV